MPSNMDVRCPPSVNPTLNGELQYAREISGSARFDPSKHLAYSPPLNILTMGDLAHDSTELSSIAHTEPFQLLSHEGVLAHRREIFSQEVLDNCMHHTRPGSVQIRGMAPRYAPFIHSFWHSPEVLEIISRNAGIDLVPVMDYEICHTNVQLGPEGMAGVHATPIEPSVATGTAIAAFEREKSKEQVTTDQTKPVVEWHRDSHPFVCVVICYMGPHQKRPAPYPLSDARVMIGGETELECGDGRTVKVKAPQMGCATILQGRYITHTAAPAANMPERVTIVTSFRPRDPTLLDETTNMNIRNKSHLAELYYQWTMYRLDVLAKRAQVAADTLRKRYEENVRTSDGESKHGLCRIETVNVAEIEDWVSKQMEYMQKTLHEMRPLETRNGRVW